MPVRPLSELIPFGGSSSHLAPRAKYRLAGGELWINFAFLGLQLRLSGWVEGLELYRQEPDGWVREEMDPQVLNLASAGRLPDYHPVRRFSAGIPAWALRDAAPYGSWQLTVLRLLRYCPAARDLARRDATLLWLFASTVDRREVSMTRASLVLERRRLDVLRWCVGETVSDSTLRFLQKVAARHTRDEIDLLERVLREPEVVAWFRHEPEARIGVLREVLRCPRLRRYRFFRDALADADQGPEVVRGLPAMVRDVRQLGTALGRTDVPAVLDNCRSVASLRQLHDRWTVVVNTEARQSRCRSYVERYGGHEFRPPPLPGTDCIVPITTLDELAAEAREMDHCVLAHAPAIFEGRAYVYRVLAPERATLEVAIEGPAGVKLQELSGRRNATVGYETKRSVLLWLRAGTTAT